jgi:methyl-accepting chemotaxis protein
LVAVGSFAPIALVATLAGTAAAQRPAPAPPPPPPPSDGLTDQDRDMRAAAEQLAADASQVIEQWLISRAVTEDRLFSRLYFPIAKTDPQKFSTPYDALADRDLVGVEDKALARAPNFQYAIVTDINAYVPAYNTRFAQPLTGNAAQDYVNNRTKRMLADPASLVAARNEAHSLIQRTRVETGDVVYDVSVPVIVHGKHWGCARIGYRRAE